MSGRHLTIPIWPRRDRNGVSGLSLGGGDPDSQYRPFNQAEMYEAQYKHDLEIRAYYPFWVCMNAVIVEYSPIKPTPEVDIYCQVFYKCPESEFPKVLSYFKEHRAEGNSLKLTDAPKIDFFFPLNETKLFEHAEGRPKFLEVKMTYNEENQFMHVQLHVAVKLPLQQQSLIRSFPLDRAYLPFELMTKREDSCNGVDITWKAYELWGSWTEEDDARLDPSWRMDDFLTFKKTHLREFRKIKEVMRGSLVKNRIYSDDLKAFSLRKEQHMTLNFYTVLRPRWYEKSKDRRPVFVVRLQNRGWHFVYTYQVPVFLLVGFVLLTAWYHARESPQPEGLIQTSFFCVSGIIAVRFVMARNLPHIAGFTFGDAYITASFLFPVLGLSVGLGADLSEPNTDYNVLLAYVYGLGCLWLFMNVVFVLLIAARSGASCSCCYALLPLQRFDTAYSSAFGHKESLHYEGRRRYMEERQERLPFGRKSLIGGRLATLTSMARRMTKVMSEDDAKKAQERAEEKEKAEEEEKVEEV